MNYDIDQNDEMPITESKEKNRKNKATKKSEWIARKTRKSHLTAGWTKKDYFQTIFLFVLHALIVAALFTVVVFLNEFSWTAFKNFFTTEETIRDFAYIMISMFFLFGMLYLFFFFESNSFLKDRKNIFMVFSIVEISLIISYIVGRYVNVYARPIAFCGLMVLLLVNRQSAIIMNIAFCLLLFMMDGIAGSSGTLVFDKTAYSSILIGLTTGLLAIYLVSNVSSRIKVFFMGFIISIPIIESVLCLELKELSQLLPLIGFGFTAGMLSVVLMMAILPFYEKIFNVVTNYRLSEITDHKYPPIKRLIDEANGTFNHSLTVSTLAESCATAIGENALLARAAAYYHDIGKLKQPEYFSENQKDFNPHCELSPELSTDIIRSHAHDGAVFINKYHLPKILADVAEQHHGTLLIRYFYSEASKYTEEKLAEKDFSYPGPTPQTKIAAIIMICDGCEAAVRSLSDRSRSSVYKMVQSIIYERLITFRQFDNCDITIKELDIIRDTVTQCLGGVYHDRISYPELKKR